LNSFLLFANSIALIMTIVIHLLIRTATEITNSKESFNQSKYKHNTSTISK
jgi:hypothetical protein